MTFVFEAIGLVSALLALGWQLSAKAPPGARSARTALALLLGLMMLSHLANLLEYRGYAWADAVGDTFSLGVPLVWALFLFEVGRAYWSAKESSSREQLAFVLSRLPACLAWIDANGRVLASSRYWDESLGAANGRELSAALPVRLPELERALEDCLGQRREQAQGEETSVQADAPTGGRTFAWSLRTVRDPDQPSSGAMLWLEETTQRIEAETERANAALEIARLQRISTVGQLVTGAAHDFNNLLQAMYGPIDALAEVPGTEAACRDLVSAVESATSLTRAMFQAGRRSGTRSGPRVLDLAELVDGFRQLLTLALGRGYHLRMQRPASPVMVLGDRLRLEQAILNLVLNARDASPRGGTIWVDVTVQDGRATLSVRDEGTGIPPEVREQLFTPFFTTKGEKGTGIGLSVVESVAREHLGSIDVESQPGAGSIFRIKLPISAASA